MTGRTGDRQLAACADQTRCGAKYQSNRFLVEAEKIATHSVSQAGLLIMSDGMLDRVGHGISSLYMIAAFDLGLDAGPPLER